MSKKEVLHRYTFFIFALFLVALGVTVVTRANLGTSPISSLAYVLSLNSPITMGTYIFMMNVVFILIQIALLKDKISERKWDISMQLPMSFLFGVFVDFTMLLTSNLNPTTYSLQIFTLLVGCVILALGVAMELIANVTMMSAEYTVDVIADLYNKEFGNVKLAFDISLITLAVISSFMLSGKLVGVREGTIIAGLITGPMVRIFVAKLSPVIPKVVHLFSRRY